MKKAVFPLNRFVKPLRPKLQIILLILAFLVFFTAPPLSAQTAESNTSFFWGKYCFAAGICS